MTLHGTPAVDFNGGEPTLLKDFDDYIKYFEEHRSRVFLFTNGLIYKQSVYDVSERHYQVGYRFIRCRNNKHI